MPGPRRDSVRVRGRDRDRDCLTIHHKFRSYRAKLRQKACRDGELVADVTRHGAWDAGMGLLVHGATRWKGRNAARRMPPRQSRQAVSERAVSERAVGDRAPPSS